MKTEFPQDFTWGTATSACQIEGAASEDGKVPSVWDAFAAKGVCANGDTPAVACDHYHRFKEDISLMKELGVKAYRFSISWPRVISDLEGTVNEKGLDFYSALVDELLSNGIKPWPTLYHWDHPQFLEDAFTGWTDRRIVKHFETYARAVVNRLGDRVTDWMTVNEPVNATYSSYGQGGFAPGLKLEGKKIANSIHHILMAHGTAVKIIREKNPKAKVGIVHDAMTFTCEDENLKKATDILFEWSNGYFMNPIYYGRYPENTYRNIPGAKPDIFPGDMELISQPTDFFGYNCYYCWTVRHSPYSLFGFDACIKEEERQDAMFGICPDTFYTGIKYIYDHYDVKNIYITENGNSWKNYDREGQINDTYRIDLIKMHLNSIKRAMNEGYKVSGYFAWSFMDNFEWRRGYDERFGLVYIDKNLERIPKKSFYWYKDTIKNNGFEN